jgi:SAM-dependent methyltransferase
MSVAAFWSARARRYGHTGWADAAVYAYDQPLRLAAVRAWLHDTADPGGAALDYGCGSGDFCGLLATRYTQVLGYDPSAAVLDIARRHRPALTFTDDLQTTLQGRYDMVLSITVMQHVADDQDLAQLLVQLATTLKPQGRLLMLETFASSAQAASGGYLKRRVREEFLAACRSAGLVLCQERGFYHPSECPTAAFTTYHQHPLVRVLARAAAWRLPGATTVLRAWGERAAAADDQALNRPNSPTRLMWFERAAL